MGTNAGVDEAGDDETGIIPRLVADLFARVNQEGDVWRRDVSVSFLEIHNDDIHDLLDQTPKVCTLREDAAGGVVVANLEEYKATDAGEMLSQLAEGSNNAVTDAGEMLSQLADGSARRATASTCMNATSSRSHAVFTILMHSSKLTSSADGEEAGEADAFVSRLHLVDLAGSERAKRTKVSPPLTLDTQP
ncbi:P-loop containing nucleoside triphosphate hydrolase protein [Baffinella frigidus]|nr:P-loop containing nucleoside triphosphate hydrolase protein [Cryptophyta sp. CCMP2293]